MHNTFYRFEVNIDLKWLIRFSLNPDSSEFWLAPEQELLKIFIWNSSLWYAFKFMVYNKVRLTPEYLATETS